MTPTRSSTLLRAAAAALALCLVPAAASAQTKRPRQDSAPVSTDVGSSYFGASFGLAVPTESNVNVGFKLNLDGFYVAQQLGPGLFLDVGGNLGFTYTGTAVADVSVNYWDILPTGRLRYAIDPAWSVYGDLGLGIGVVSASSSFGSASNTDFLMKIGGGAAYKVSSQWLLVAEPAFNVYAGDWTVFTLMLAAQYRM